jgi:hypothetical protein
VLRQSHNPLVWTVYASGRDDFRLAWVSDERSAYPQIVTATLDMTSSELVLRDRRTIGDPRHSNWGPALARGNGRFLLAYISHRRDVRGIALHVLED